MKDGKDNGPQESVNRCRRKGCAASRKEEQYCYDCCLYTTGIAEEHQPTASEEEEEETTIEHEVIIAAPIANRREQQEESKTLQYNETSKVGEPNEVEMTAVIRTQGIKTPCVSSWKKFQNTDGNRRFPVVLSVRLSS